MTSQHPDTCAVVVDQENRKIYEFRKTILVNQVTRDAEKIGNSFDKIHGDDLQKISEQFAFCLALLTSGMIKASKENDDLRIACGELLSNALNSLAATTHLIRGGFVLQPGIIIRSCYESLAVVLHLMQNQTDLDDYKNHKFDSPRAITSAKHVFPPYGKLYGFFSNEFTHIGKLHKQVTTIREYTENDDALSANIMFISAGVWMAYVTCELTFLDVVALPRYWSEVSVDTPSHSAYCYNPSPEEKTWMEGFLNIPNAP